MQDVFLIIKNDIRLYGLLHLVSNRIECTKHKGLKSY